MANVQGLRVPHCAAGHRDDARETCVRPLGRANEHLDWQAIAGEGRWVPISLAANSVQGKDLLRFTVESLKTDLNFNTFAAQKICDLRDEFLH